MADIAKVIHDTLSEDYYLAGGTALALHLGHRKSVDLDYFLNKDIDTLVLKEKLTELFSADVQILFEEKNTLWCSIRGVKASFISRFDTLLDSIEVVGAFRLAGLKDITAMKLSAICGREEYKDYFDLACLAGETDAREWVSWWYAVYPQADATSFIVALAYADKMAPVPLDIFDVYKNLDVKSELFTVARDITTDIS